MLPIIFWWRVTWLCNSTGRNTISPHLSSQLKNCDICCDKNQLIFHVRSSRVKNSHFYVRFPSTELRLWKIERFLSWLMSQFFSCDERWGEMVLVRVELDNVAARHQKIIGNTFSWNRWGEVHLLPETQWWFFFANEQKSQKLEIPLTSQWEGPHSKFLTNRYFWHRFVRFFEWAFIVLRHYCPVPQISYLKMLRISRWKTFLFFIYLKNDH